jgi:phosphoribosylformylglycinamidine cyclo-ligase
MKKAQMQDGARGPHARRTPCTLSVRPRAPTPQMGLFQQPARGDMTSKPSISYRDTGVLDNAELGLRALLKWIDRTASFRPADGLGRKVIDVGFFASVVDIGHGLGLALCTDGVGSKVLVAEMLERYDTIGIDCVAMNVNDAICVGAEPVSFLDYIATERAVPEVLEQIGRGLHEGARLAGVSIVGGEISQIPEIIKGERPGRGLDLVGMCVGVVPLSRVIVGQHVEPGDLIIGVRSSGIHSNGLTLARRALFGEARLRPDEHVAELGCRVGEELLKPTHIYVAPVLDLLRRELPVRALAHVTGDGLLNLPRIAATVGFRIESLPKPPPIFDLIQKSGNVTAAEMFRVFNMGIGFCVIVPSDPGIAETVRQCLADHGFEASVIGRVVEDEAKRVLLVEQNLVGEGDRFRLLP